MFRSATLKLTLSYLAILMVISLAFSAVLYRVSASQITSTLDHQAGYLRRQPYAYQYLQQIQNLRDTQLGDSLGQLQLGLLFLNLGTLSLGGGLSYWLARRTLEPIEQAHQAQSRFASDASHELRTPLTAIKSEIEVALRAPELTPDQARQLLTSNLEEVAKLQQLSGALLQLARTQTLGPETLETVKLERVITAAAGRLSTAAGQKNISIKTGVTGVALQAQPDSLIELVTILLDNAVKYSPAGAEISVRAGRKGDQAVIRVSDPGIGIAAADLPHIFDRFYRADSSRAKDQTPGYGLGLSLAQQIAQLHKGTIEVTSQPGQGSVFTVKLPLSQGKQHFSLHLAVKKLFR